MEYSDWNSSKSWEIARSYAELLNPIPPSVSDAIRTLWRNHEANKKIDKPEIETISFDVVARVDKTAIIKSPLYFAALDLYEERFEETKEDDTSRALLRILGIEMFANLLGLIYLHRRLNKLQNSEIWQDLSKEYALHMQLGYLIGEQLAEVGSGTGLLVGGIRYAGLGILLKERPQEFQKYRSNNHSLRNLAEEHRIWGCDHAQVAAYLIRILGMDVDVIESANALRPSVISIDKVVNKLRPWRAAAFIVDLAANKQQPDANKLMDVGVKVDQDILTQLFWATENLVDNGTTFNWMFRPSKNTSSEDI